MRQTLERELKLTPSEGFRLSDLGGVELPSRDFVSTYYDTPELTLARHDITLRHRSEDGSGLWQLKVPRGATRIELEIAGTPARPPSELVALLFAHLRGDEPVRVARLRTRRKTLRADGAEIVEDSVAVLDGQRITSRFRELEIELVTGGDERTLRRLEKALRRAGSESVEFRPKLFRALELSSPTPRPALADDASFSDVLVAALSDQHDRLLAHDPGTRLGSDPEDLHQMRVATRRARAFLRAAEPLLDSEWAGDLRDELRWIGSALGPARDLDVLLERLEGEIARLGDERRGVQGLLDGFERQRRKARAVVVSALSEERYPALLDRLETPEPRLAPDAQRTLAELWWAEFGRARRAFGRLDDDSSDDELHAARIKVKRSRYAAELAAHELGAPGERFVDAAKELQDVLGDHQDAFVAEERIRAWAEGKPQAGDAVRKLLKRERARRKKARAEWPEAWKLLNRRARKARL
ncbi:MAG: CHAD domain-containing protein [Gaiellaceae bacterium]